MASLEVDAVGIEAGGQRRFVSPRFGVCAVLDGVVSVFGSGPGGPGCYAGIWRPGLSDTSGPLCSSISNPGDGCFRALPFSPQS